MKIISILFLSFIYAASLFLLVSKVSAEVSIRNIDYKIPSGGSFKIVDLPQVFVDGVIQSGMEIAFEDAIKTVKETAGMFTLGGNSSPLVVLASPGGDVATAMLIGQIARRNGAHTFVPENVQCSSACVLIFAAGVDRWVAEGGQLGLHRPRFSDFAAFAELDQEAATVIYSGLLDQIEEYLSLMRIDPEFTKEFLDTSSGSIRFIDQQQAISLGIMGTDAAYSEWDNAQLQSSMPEAEFQKLNALLTCFDECKTSECQAQCYVPYQQ